MFKLLFKWVVTSLVILMVPYVVKGVEVNSYGAALATAAILGVLNVAVKPILVILTFPLTLLSLGLFILVINAFLFYFTGSLVEGMKVASFGSAFVASLLVSFVSWIMNLSTEKKGGRRVIVVRRTERPSASEDNRNIRDLN